MPIVTGEKVAEMQIFSSSDKLLSSTPLFAVRAVEPTLRYQARLIWKRVQKGVSGNITLVLAAGGILVSGGHFLLLTQQAKKCNKVMNSEFFGPRLRGKPDFNQGLFDFFHRVEFFQ